MTSVTGGISPGFPCCLVAGFKKSAKIAVFGLITPVVSYNVVVSCRGSCRGSCHGLNHSKAQNRRG